MDILVNVANQKLKIAANLKSLVKGTRKNPSLDTIYKIATAFNIDMMDLIGRE